MAAKHIDMAGIQTKKFVANTQMGTDYSATIQNNTNRSLTVTVTNENIQAATNFDAPASGALVIAAGAMGALAEPYEGWLLTLATGVANAGSTIDVSESGQ